MTATALSRSAPGRPAPAVGGKLRVAVVAGNYNYVMDGMAKSLNMLVSHLLRRGHEVFVLAPTARAPAFEHAGTLFPIPSVPLPGRRAEYRIGLGLLPSAKERLDAFAPDLIHIATPDLTGLTALNYAEKNGIPVVASFHTRFDTYPRYYGMSWLEKHLTRYMRWLYGRCIHVYPPTQSMLDELREQGIGRDLRLWRRGVDGALFNPARRDMTWRRGLGLDDGDVVVGFVGRLVLEKGIDLFARALGQARAREPRLRALVVGDGPERARFESQLPGEVFVGHQTGEALARAYASADIFFNPSITETAGNVTLEAMACGLPTLAADAPGSRSYVRDGETGVLMAEGATAEEFADRLLALAGDAVLRGRMGAAARRRIETQHSWDDALDEVIGHYRAALESYDAGRRRGRRGFLRAVPDPLRTRP